MERGAKPARGARARRLSDRLADRPLDERRIMREVRVERADHFGRRAFLRSENRGSAVRADERVVDVAGDLDRSLGETGINPGNVDPREIRERAAAVSQFPPACVEKPDAKRLQHSGAAVVGRASADADDEATRAFVERGSDEFADAKGCGDKRIAFCRRGELEFRGRRHLDHRDAAVASHTVEGFDRVAERSGHAAHKTSTSCRRHERIDRSLPAIGDGKDDIVGVGVDLAKSVSDLDGDVERGQAFLKGVRRDDDLHRRLLEGINTARRCCNRGFPAPCGAEPQAAPSAGCRFHP